MRFFIDGTFLDIDDKYVINSPLLSTMLNTHVQCEKIEDAYVLDLQVDSMRDYLSFLQGEYVPHMDMTLLQYMGHENTMNYPEDVFCMKLHDEWVRDNMYRYELYTDQYYDLVQIPILQKIEYTPPKGWYIAGGAALYMAGYTGKYSDIDLFTTLCRDEAEKSMEYLVDGDKNISVSGYSVTHNSRVNKYRCKIQHILRLYKSLSEIVHGFDLDCVGIIFDGDKLWCTRRTHFSLIKKMNYFDPKRASPSYAYRLVKYMAREFAIFLPHSEYIIPNEYRVTEYFNTIKYHYDKQIEDETERENTYKEESTLTMQEKIDMMKKFIATHNNKHGIVSCNIGTMNRKINEIFNTEEEEEYSIPQMAHYANGNIIPIRDPASLLILAVKYNFYRLDAAHYVADYEHKSRKCSYRYAFYPNTINHRSAEIFRGRDPIGYEKEREQYINKEKYKLGSTDLGTKFLLDISRLKWKEQNPMEQVSSTCMPTPIQDIREWYRTSPLCL
jgi:hypothetical protein